MSEVDTESIGTEKLRNLDVRTKQIEDHVPGIVFEEENCDTNRLSGYGLLLEKSKHEVAIIVGGILLPLLSVIALYYSLHYSICGLVIDAVYILFIFYTFAPLCNIIGFIVQLIETGLQRPMGITFRWKPIAELMPWKTVGRVNSRSTV